MKIYISKRRFAFFEYVRCWNANIMDEINSAVTKTQMTMHSVHRTVFFLRPEDTRGKRSTPACQFPKKARQAFTSVPWKYRNNGILPFR